jgi:hypothetical protein
MQALHIDNGMSKEESKRLALVIITREEVKKEFEEIRKQIPIKPTNLRQGAQHIKHLKTHYGKKEFEKRKAFIISEHGATYSTMLSFTYWWELMYRDMIDEFVEKRMTCKQGES